MILKNIVFCFDGQKVLENIDIIIENGKIKSIGKNLDHNDSQVLDCSNKIVLPGLINLHAHGGMNILRGIEDDMELNDWLNKVIWPAEAKLNSSDIYYGSLSSYLESVASGITTIVDAYFKIESMEAAASNSKIRAFLSPAIFSETDWKEYKKSNFFNSQNDLLKPFVFIHSLYATDLNIIEEINDYCIQNNFLKGVHISETRNEIIDIKNKNSDLPIYSLNNMDFFKSKTLLVHGTWMTKDEIKLLKEKDVSVVHCPISNMKLSSGAVLPLMECFENNINVGLGTDSVVSNNSIDLFMEMKQTGLLHKQHRWDPTVANNHDIIQMATVNGAKALGLDNLGLLKENYLADMVFLNLNDVNLIGTDTNNLISNLIYSASRSNVSDVMINGEFVYKNKEFQFDILDHNQNKINLKELNEIIVDIRKKL